MIRDVVGVSVVDVAANGAEALAIALAATLDVVVLDIHMPGADGFAALPRLKGLASPPVVVVMTNDPSERHRRRCVSLGADFFFDKSRHFDQAIEAIAELARRRERGLDPLGAGERRD